MKRRLYFLRAEPGRLVFVEKTYPGLLARLLLRRRMRRVEIAYARRASGWVRLDTEERVSTDRSMFLDWIADKELACG